MANWFLYIVRGKDGSLYTGITTDLDRRVLEHNTSNALGAKSLRAKRPVEPVYYEILPDHRAAAKREKSIKRWTRQYKLRLIEGFRP